MSLEKKYKSVGIVGAGAWGTALATVCARAGLKTTIWAFEDTVASEINTSHENKTYLKGISLNPEIIATTDLQEVAQADFLLMVVPAQFMRSIATELAPNVHSGTPLVICAKGIETKSGLMMSGVLAEVAPQCPIAALSGPTFASEVARGLPAAVTIAAESQTVAHNLTTAIGQPKFRPYWTDDIIGAQIGGTVKNIMAIACGIVAGLGLGENARAALITRGAAEMIRFAEAHGGSAETLMGLCGMGDLILTCSSTQSRNMSLGLALGQGAKIKDLMKGRKTVAEGYYNAVIVHEIAEAKKIDMPITKAVHAILHEGAEVAAETKLLLDRPFARESD